MKHLIMKDMRLVGIANLVLIVVTAIGGYIGASLDMSFKSNFAYAFTMVVALFLVNTMIITKESKSKSDPLMISLPVSKFDIVKARYLTMIIYILAVLLTISLTSNISKILFDNMPGSPLGLTEMFIILSITIIFLSFYIPFQYHNLKNAQMLSTFLYMIIVLSPNLLSRFGLDIDNLGFLEKILRMDYGSLGFILIALGLVLYVMSTFVSKGIYEAKEF